MQASTRDHPYRGPFHKRQLSRNQRSGVTDLMALGKLHSARNQDERHDQERAPKLQFSTSHHFSEEPAWLANGFRETGIYAEFRAVMAVLAILNRSCL